MRKVNLTTRVSLGVVVVMVRTQYWEGESSNNLQLTCSGLYFFLYVSQSIEVGNSEGVSTIRCYGDQFAAYHA